MKEYALPRLGTTARINLLDGGDLNEVIALQDATRAALPEGMKQFVLPQSQAYFQNLLMRQTGLMVGIRANGVLIAHMALMGPMELREAIALRLITNNDIAFHHASLTDSVILFKSMAVHPDYRGNDLGRSLLSFALDQPFTKIADHVFAQVSAGNKRSWDAFAKLGFAIVAAGYDPKDGKPRFVFQKPAFGFDLSPVIADEVDPVADFPAIVNLTGRDALVGFYEEGSSGKLAFQRDRDVVHVLPTLAKVTSGE
jgi:ribosomal protein S18 acetylase RimI-like enzyme